MTAQTGQLNGRPVHSRRPPKQDNAQTKAPAFGEGSIPGLSAWIRDDPWRKALLLRRFGGLGVLAAETLHAACGIHELLLPGEEGMAVRANFYADVAPMGRTGREGVAAGAVHADFAIGRMNCCFHVGLYLDSDH